MRGAPHVRFSATMRKINSRSSLHVGFLPTTACLRESHFQYSLNPLRCQRMTVSGCTMTSAPFHPDQNRRIRTQKIRSDVAKCGRDCFCVIIASCWRRATFSRIRSRRERKSPVACERRGVIKRNILHFRIRIVRRTQLFQRPDSEDDWSFGEAQLRFRLQRGPLLNTISYSVIPDLGEQVTSSPPP